MHLNHPQARILDGFVALAQAPGPYSRAQFQELVNTLAEPNRLDQAHLAELEKIAKKAAPDHEDLWKALAGHSSDGSRWLRAMREEAAGRHRQAADLLEGLWQNCDGEDRAYRLLASARNLSKVPDMLQAAHRLAEAAKATTSNRTLSSLDRLLTQLRKQGELPSRRKCRIALLGTSTLEFWLPALRVQCFARGIDAQIHVGPFGQYQQEILSPSSATAAFKPDIVVIAPTSNSLGFLEEMSDSAKAVEEKIAALRSLWRRVKESWGAFVIQVNAEIPGEDPYGRLSAALPGGRGRALRMFNLQLWDAERAESGVAILDLEQVASRFGKDRWADPVLWNTAKQYPSTPAIPFLTHNLAALCAAATGLSAKCVAVDLDGVVWGGVIGEDGLGGIQVGGGPVGEAHVAFQRYLKGLSARGILLAACSKNNREDALLPFHQHSDMVLREEDFAVFVANWETKDRNLREIAKLLNIGLDAIVFVDDNPMERSMVRQNVPEVEVVELPRDPSGYVAALDAPLYFEALSLTQEDRVRGKSLRENQERMALEAAAGTVDDYLASLQMSVELCPFRPDDHARIVQLINKTNQFNLTTRRLQDRDVQSLMAQPGCYTQTLRVADRFGDSGLTGVLIAVREGDALRIHTWLMSCRVMGRRLEEVVFGSLLEHARGEGITAIQGDYIPTAKNSVVANLYPQLGFHSVADGRYERPVHVDFASPTFLKIVDHTNKGAILNAGTN